MSNFNESQSGFNLELVLEETLVVVQPDGSSRRKFVLVGTRRVLLPFAPFIDLQIDSARLVDITWHTQTRCLAAQAHLSFFAAEDLPSEDPLEPSGDSSGRSLLLQSEQDAEYLLLSLFKEGWDLHPSTPYGSRLLQTSTGSTQDQTPQIQTD